MFVLHSGKNRKLCRTRWTCTLWMKFFLIFCMLHVENQGSPHPFTSCHFVPHRKVHRAPFSCQVDTKWVLVRSGKRSQGAMVQSGKFLFESNNLIRNFLQRAPLSLSTIGSVADYMHACFRSVKPCRPTYIHIYTAGFPLGFIRRVSVSRGNV